MKRINVRCIVSALAVMLLFSQMDLHAQVTVVLQQPPPFQFKIEHMWKVTLINPTTTTYRVYLHGVASESAKGQIVSATTAAFSLAPGVKVVNSRELVPMSVDVNNNKYANVVENVGAVPTGDYEICVTVFNAETGVELGTQCIQAQTQNMSQVELLLPENGVKIISGGGTDVAGSGNDGMTTTGTKTNEDTGIPANYVNGSSITFNWLPPSPIPPGVKATYSIRIAEMLGNQSPSDALLSNPAFYKNQNIYSSVFLYPTGGRRFENNRTYAWQVGAYLNNELISESETWEFTYTDNSQHTFVDNKSTSANELGNTSSSFAGQHLLLASTDNSQLADMIYENEKENKPSPLLFSGNAKLSWETGYKDLPFSEVPKSILTAELNPSLILYDLPITANILLSSQNGSDRQSINRFAFNVDFKSYRENLKTRLGDKIKELSGWDNFMMSFIALGIGINYPSYSDYTLKGVPVTGINVELNPGILYAAFAASKNQRSIQNIAYQRNLYAGRLGLGKKEGTHLFFTGVYVKDDENSMTVSSTTSAMGPSISPGSIPLTPKANDVFGMETKLALFQDHILIEGEGNAAILTRDTRDADLEIKEIPSWIKGVLHPKISSSFDYSYSGKISYNNTGSATRISFNTKMIGPGYVSLGAPNLRNDQIAYEAKAEQGLFSRKISLSTFFRTSHDNLIDWKSSTTTTSAYGLNLGLNFPKLPFLQVSYSPVVQKNDDSVLTRKVENKTSMLSAVTGYVLLIDELNISTTVAYTRNEALTLSGLSDYHTNSISITEGVSFNNPFSFSGTWGLIKTASLSLNSHISNYDFSVNAAFSEFLTSTIGVDVTAEEAVNHKTGFYLTTTISPWKNITLNARAEQTAYKDLADNTLNYDELIFHVALNVQW
ncbi:MAG: hypothetical protein EHM64_00915 [Ignavibacteriae bacterium]|nr:MAG: hypothetical protein EHM64_00915 [Ignavibacteriota bacterium]